MRVDIPTIYLFVGVLYLVLPATAWLVLSAQRSQVAVMWCMGGEIVGIGMLLFGFRKGLPAWVTYSLGNYALWVGNALLMLAVARILGYRWRGHWLAMGGVVFALFFEYFRLVLESPHLRFLSAALIMIGMFVCLALMSLQLAKIEGVRSARWLSRAYFASASLLIFRCIRVIVGDAEPEALAGSLDSALIVSAGLITSVLGNFSFIAIFLERSSHQLLQITEQRVRQEEVNKLNEQITQLDRQRTLGAMSASFAHELSQPLTAILMDAQNAKTSLQEAHPDVSAIQRTVEEIETGASRMASLIDRIRNFIRPSPLSRDWVNLEDLAKEVPQLLSHDIRREAVAFDFEFEAGNWTILGDRVQLSQILLNVYRNAIQAMTHSAYKKIRVVGELTADQVVIRIQDTGPGLSDELKGKVGTPFITSKLDGLGVGFSISKAIAETHGGHLSITNAQGSGAVVELRLPITPPGA